MDRNQASNAREDCLTRTGLETYSPHPVIRRVTLGDSSIPFLNGLDRNGDLSLGMRHARRVVRV